MNLLLKETIIFIGHIEYHLEVSQPCYKSSDWHQVIFQFGTLILMPRHLRMHKLQYSYLYLTLLFSIKHCVIRIHEVCSCIDKHHIVGKVGHTFILYELNCSVFKSLIFDFILVAFLELHRDPINSLQ